MRTIYFDKEGPRRQPGFRGFGAARRLRARDELHPIREELYWALFELGLANDFARLSASCDLEPYCEGTLQPEDAERAASLLEERAQSLAQQRYDWLCSRQLRPDHVEYRISVDAPELASELESLSRFFTSASAAGDAVQLAL
mgnify:CR=1 FL=1